MCLSCQSAQAAYLERNHDRCAGSACSKTQENGVGGRYCTWCSLPLPSTPTRAESRREYDRIHLLARSLSTIDRSPKYEAKDLFEHPFKIDRAFDRLQIDDSVTKSEKPAKAYANDPCEDERIRTIEAVSQRRRLATSAAEEERWRKSELMRQDSRNNEQSDRVHLMYPRLRAELTRWQSCDSTASTLVLSNEDFEPPTYDESQADYLEHSER